MNLKVGLGGVIQTLGNFLVVAGVFVSGVGFASGFSGAINQGTSQGYLHIVFLGLVITIVGFGLSAAGSTQTEGS